MNVNVTGTEEEDFASLMSLTVEDSVHILINVI